MWSSLHRFQPHLQFGICSMYENETFLPFFTAVFWSAHTKKSITKHFLLWCTYKPVLCPFVPAVLYAPHAIIVPNHKDDLRDHEFLSYIGYLRHWASFQRRTEYLIDFDPKTVKWQILKMSKKFITFSIAVWVVSRKYVSDDDLSLDKIQSNRLESFAATCEEAWDERFNSCGIGFWCSWCCRATASSFLLSITFSKQASKGMRRSKFSVLGKLKSQTY